MWLKDNGKIIPCVIYGEQSDIGILFLTVLLFSPVSIIPPAPRTHSIIGCITDAIHLDLLVAS